MIDSKQKLYIAQLRYDTWQKNLYLEGDDSEQGEEKFKRVLVELEDVAKKSKDWPDYIGNAISHFSENGFFNIKK